MVQMALERAGWGYDTPAEKALLRQAILVSAGESGMNPTNDGNPYCSGLFQIQGGKGMYGTWTAAEVNNPPSASTTRSPDSPGASASCGPTPTASSRASRTAGTSAPARTALRRPTGRIGPVLAYENEEYIGDRGRLVPRRSRSRTRLPAWATTRSSTRSSTPRSPRRCTTLVAGSRGRWPASWDCSLHDIKSPQHDGVSRSRAFGSGFLSIPRSRF